jgi:hypothetical protein
LEQVLRNLEAGAQRFYVSYVWGEVFVVTAVITGCRLELRRRGAAGTTTWVNPRSRIEDLLGLLEPGEAQVNKYPRDKDGDDIYLESLCPVADFRQSDPYAARFVLRYLTVTASYG